jgi:16S rRNA (adenine1518-N6/adenine1519-N6)-dimethyltransferase
LTDTGPKKRFGQHFLKDKHIAEKICNSLSLLDKDYHELLEIGPGQGVLTQYLYPRLKEKLFLVEIDRDLVPNLIINYPLIADHIYQHDFLTLPLENIFTSEFGIIGNFPYNISSQIIFRLVEYKSSVPELVGMFQREVAQRICAQPGTKIYGLLSAWVQTFYQTEYLFTVQEGSFNPPPKVKSGVIRLIRKPDYTQPFNEGLLLSIIKNAFGQRRKTLRNSLRSFQQFYASVPEGILDKRAEQLSSDDFITLARIFQE